MGESRRESRGESMGESRCESKAQELYVRGGRDKEGEDEAGLWHFRSLNEQQLELYDMQVEGQVEGRVEGRAEERVDGGVKE